MRTKLAILDHHYNVEQQQATTFEDLPRFKLEFSERGKKWVATGA